MANLMDELINELYVYYKNDIPYRLIGVDYNLRDRSERITVVDIITDCYDADEHDLKRLSDFLVHEELTDKHPDKMSREEYPFMSDTQLARRISGRHRKKDGNGILEVPLHLAENNGTDGRNYNYPDRRKRTWQEGMFIDERAQSRNKERRKTYNDFIYGRTKGVYTVDIDSGVKTIHNEEKYEEIYWN